MALATLIMLAHLGQIENAVIWAIYLILFREIAIMGLRSYLPKVANMGSSKLGKIKSTILNLSIFLFIISIIYGCHELTLFANGALIFASILSVISGARYFASVFQLMRKR